MVVAGVGNVHMLGYRAISGVCVGRATCKYMLGGEIRGSATGSGANSRRPGCQHLLACLQGPTTGACMVLEASIRNQSQQMQRSGCQ